MAAVFSSYYEAQHLKIHCSSMCKRAFQTVVLKFFCRHLSWWSDKYANMLNGTGMYVH